MGRIRRTLQNMLKSRIMTTLEVIYENGIFKPLSSVPKSFKEHERMKIIIETDDDLENEIAQWEDASDEDCLNFEESLGEKS